MYVHCTLFIIKFAISSYTIFCYTISASLTNVLFFSSPELFISLILRISSSSWFNSSLISSTLMDFPQSTKLVSTLLICVELFLCLDNCLPYLKDNSHISQLYGLSPVWIRLCFIRYFLREKVFTQNSHLNVFSIRSILLWLFKLLYY